MAHIERILIIDDDKALNFVTELTIKKVSPAMEVVSFDKPENGLGFITDVAATGFTLMLLDLNMPGLTGWELLDEFAMLSEEKTKKFIIYILSSSIDDNDAIKAANHPLVTAFIQKPLTKSKVEEIINAAVIKNTA